MASRSGDLDSDLRIVGVRERMGIMGKAVRSYTTSSKLFTLRDEMGGEGGDYGETSLKNVSLAGHPVLPRLLPQLHPPKSRRARQGPASPAITAERMGGAEITSFPLTQ